MGAVCSPTSASIAWVLRRIGGPGPVWRRPSGNGLRWASTVSPQPGISMKPSHSRDHKPRPIVSRVCPFRAAPRGSLACAWFRPLPVGPPAENRLTRPAPPTVEVHRTKQVCIDNKIVVTKNQAPKERACAGGDGQTCTGRVVAGSKKAPHSPADR